MATTYKRKILKDRAVEEENRALVRRLQGVKPTLKEFKIKGRTEDGFRKLARLPKLERTSSQQRQSYRLGGESETHFREREEPRYNRQHSLAGLNNLNNPQNSHPGYEEVPLGDAFADGGRGVEREPLDSLPVDDPSMYGVEAVDLGDYHCQGSYQGSYEAYDGSSGEEEEEEEEESPRKPGEPADLNRYLYDDSEDYMADQIGSDGDRKPKRKGPTGPPINTTGFSLEFIPTVEKTAFHAQWMDITDRSNPTVLLEKTALLSNQDPVLFNLSFEGLPEAVKDVRFEIGLLDRTFGSLFLLSHWDD